MSLWESSRSGVWLHHCMEVGELLMDYPRIRDFNGCGICNAPPPEGFTRVRSRDTTMGGLGRLKRKK